MSKFKVGSVVCTPEDGKGLIFYDDKSDTPYKVRLEDVITRTMVADAVSGAMNKTPCHVFQWEWFDEDDLELVTAQDGKPPVKVPLAKRKAAAKALRVAHKAFLKAAAEADELDVSYDDVECVEQFEISVQPETIVY